MNGTLGWDAVAAIGVVCLVLSAFFSGSETGYMSVSTVRLRRTGEGDSPRAQMLRRHLKTIEEPILSCLIGTNLFNVLFSAVVTVALSERLGAAGEWLAVAVVSVLVILFGEIVPKVLYREYPEKLILASVPALNVFMALAWPVRVVLRGYRRLWGRWLRAGGDTGTGLDRRSLAALLLTNTMPSSDDRRFATFLNRYLKLAQKPLAEIMRPLASVETVTPDTTVGECLSTAARSGFSRLPISDPGGRDMAAYVLVRDLIFLPRDEHDRPVPRRLWRTILLVDARMSPYELFEELRSQTRQLAVVTDPQGNPQGMITLEDLIETVMGSIYDEFDAATGAVA